ncbi:MAG: hypothetical protein LBK94_03715 [Prevotellaceae bacterium]|jgi:hypothetical protein|nr:hypothetical protein [Prevotellaceae bacterium]
MSEKILDTLGVNKIKEEIDSLIVELCKANDNLVTFGENVAASFKSAVAALKEVKKAANFTELNEATKNAVKQNKELEATLNKKINQQKESNRLEERLTAARSKEAVEVQKLKIQIAEETKQRKAEAQAMLAVEKVKNNYVGILDREIKSIKDLEVQNSLLRAVVDGLDIEGQADKIEYLNKIIEKNDEKINKNKDSYIQQKRNIGNYKSVLEDLDKTIETIVKKMDELTKSGDTQSEEFENLQAQLNDAKQKQAEYIEIIDETVEKEDSLAKQLNAVKIRMQELNLVAKEDWTAEMKAEYEKLRKQAEEFGKAIKRTADEIKELSKNNLSLRGMSETFKLVTASMQLGQKAAQDLGLSTESYQEILVQLQYAQATINSLDTISNALRAKSVIMIGLQSAAESKYILIRKSAIATQKILNMVQKAMPFLMAATMLASVISWIVKLTKSTSAAKEAQKDLNKAQIEAVKGASEQISKIEALAKMVAKGNVSISQQQIIIKNLNEIVKESGRVFKNYEDAQKFIVEEKDKYINALKERAKAQALIGEYTKAYAELLEKEMKKEQEHTKKYDDDINKLNAKIQWFSKQMDNVDFSGGLESLQAAARETVQVIDDANKTETQKLDDELAKRKQAEKAALDEQLQQLLDKYNAEVKATKANTEERNRLWINYLAAEKWAKAKSRDNEKKIEADYQKQMLAVTEKTEELRIRAMKDGYDREAAALKAARDKELKDVKKDSENYNSIIEYYQKEEIKLRNEYSQKLLDVKKTNIANQLVYVREGSREQLNLIIENLNIQYKEEIKAAQKTGADVKAIEDKYRKLREDAEQEHKQKAANVQQTDIDNQLAYVKKGSQQEFTQSMQMAEYCTYI